MVKAHLEDGDWSRIRKRLQSTCQNSSVAAAGTALWTLIAELETSAPGPHLAFGKARKKQINRNALPYKCNWVVQIMPSSIASSPLLPPPSIRMFRTTRDCMSHLPRMIRNGSRGL